MEFGIRTRQVATMFATGLVATGFSLAIAHADSAQANNNTYTATTKMRGDSYYHQVKAAVGGDVTVQRGQGNNVLAIDDSGNVAKNSAWFWDATNTKAGTSSSDLIKSLGVDGTAAGKALAGAWDGTDQGHSGTVVIATDGNGQIVRVWAFNKDHQPFMGFYINGGYYSTAQLSTNGQAGKLNQASQQVDKMKAAQSQGQNQIANSGIHSGALGYATMHRNGNTATVYDSQGNVQKSTAWFLDATQTMKGQSDQNVVNAYGLQGTKLGDQLAKAWDAIGQGKNGEVVVETDANGRPNWLFSTDMHGHYYASGRVDANQPSSQNSQNNQNDNQAHMVQPVTPHADNGSGNGQADNSQSNQSNSNSQTNGDNDDHQNTYKDGHQSEADSNKNNATSNDNHATPESENIKDVKSLGDVRASHAGMGTLAKDDDGHLVIADRYGHKARDGSWYFDGLANMRGKSADEVTKQLGISGSLADDFSDLWNKTDQGQNGDIIFTSDYTGNVTFMSAVDKNETSLGAYSVKKAEPTNADGNWQLKGFTRIANEAYANENNGGKVWDLYGQDVTPKSRIAGEVALKNINGHLQAYDYDGQLAKNSSWYWDAPVAEKGKAASDIINELGLSGTKTGQLIHEIWDVIDAGNNGSLVVTTNKAGQVVQIAVTNVKMNAGQAVNFNPSMNVSDSGSASKGQQSDAKNNSQTDKANNHDNQGDSKATISNKPSDSKSSDAQKTSGEWVKDASGNWEYVQNGQAISSQWVNDGKGWYYMNKDGHMDANTWHQDGNSWYYLGADGKMETTSWIKSADGKNWFFVGNDGRLVTSGWGQDKDGSWYHFDGDGKMQTNSWAKDSKGQWYYLGSDGKMVKNIWQRNGNDWYYLGDSGAMKTSSIVKSGNDTYYVNSDGKMVTNSLQKADGDHYYFGSDGKAVNNNWHQTKSGDYYYFDNSGKAVKNPDPSKYGVWLVRINNNDYDFNADGRMVVGWVKDRVGWTYFTDHHQNLQGAKVQNLPQGAMLKDGWVNVNNSGWYYLQGMVAYTPSLGTPTLLTIRNGNDAKTYVTDENGKLLTDASNVRIDLNKIPSKFLDTMLSAMPNRSMADQIQKAAQDQQNGRGHRVYVSSFGDGQLSNVTIDA